MQQVPLLLGWLAVVLFISACFILGWYLDVILDRFVSWWQKNNCRHVNEWGKTLGPFQDYLDQTHSPGGHFHCIKCGKDLYLKNRNYKYGEY